MSTVTKVCDIVMQWVGKNHKSIVVAVGGIVMTRKVTLFVIGKIADYKRKKAWEKWKGAPRDTVIFHTLPRGITIPNLSPFAMKLETFLRISNIPYEIDFEERAAGRSCGPLGKTPWITLNGEHIADSQLIIKLLTAKYNVKIGDYSEEQQAIAKAVRVMMDEYFYWGISLWRYVHSDGNGMDQIFDMSPDALRSFFRHTNAGVRQRAWSQGIGRHSKEQVIELMKDTLKTASLLVGDKTFLLGDKPCEEDCALFGMLGMVMWAAPGSPYEAYVKDELPNLVNYCNLMKTRYWSDWDQYLAKKS